MNRPYKLCGIFIKFNVIAPPPPPLGVGAYFLAEIYFHKTPCVIKCKFCVSKILNHLFSLLFCLDNYFILWYTCRTSAVMAAEGGFHKAELPSSSGNSALNQTGGAEMREKITLACTECKQRNYDSKKNKKNTPDRLELNKYCRFCRKHTLHKETK